LLASVALCAVAGPAFADVPRAEIRGDLSSDLRRQLERAVGETKEAPASRFEARRRARTAVQNATDLLRSEGYYQPSVEDEVEGEERAIAVVRVDPGKRFTLDQSLILWSTPAPDDESAQTATENLGLELGAPGRAVDIISAEGRIVSGLIRNGYADAEALPRRVVVDHATYSVQPNFNIDSGQLVRLNGLRVRTFGETDPEWVRGLAPWSEGDRFNPENLAELERRLVDTGVYENVAVALTPKTQTTEDGLRPVTVSLTDRPRKLTEAGATYSTTDGIGLDVFQTRYNRLNRADTLRYGLRYASIDSRLGGELTLPHWRKPGRRLKLGAWAVYEETDAYDRAAVTLNADLSQRIGKTSYISYGLGLDAGHYRETRFDPITELPMVLDRNLAILTARGAAYMDRSNDPLDPTRGYRFDVSIQPTAVTGEDNVFFLRNLASATAYLPVQEGDRTVLAGRVRIGTIIGGQEITVPSDRLFFSGGGGSVRGYSYQSINPRWPDNTPRGGLSLFETSFEVRRDIGEKFQAVAFVDAGAVGFQETPNLSNMRYGAGVGVRYKLPFGPVRADIAIPLNKRDGDSEFQLYLSIGQAF
jgi:translocation and assembly module TamA